MRDPVQAESVFPFDFRFANPRKRNACAARQREPKAYPLAPPYLGLRPYRAYF